MSASVVVPRLPDSTAAQASSGKLSSERKLVDPPSVMAIRLAFGVGTSDSLPTPESFKTTYHLSIPVFSLGGLDPDGVYEFDAAALYDMISKRSLRRRWGVRLELELQQSPLAVSAADIHIQAPFSEDAGLGMFVLGQSGRGTPLPGGGRTLVAATGLITDIKRVSLLSGAYEIQLRDEDPAGDAPARVASMSRSVQVDVTRFEFEG